MTSNVTFPVRTLQAGRRRSLALGFALALTGLPAGITRLRTK